VSGALDFDVAAVLVVLLLAGAANTAPLIAAKLLGARLAWPLDGGVHLRDGRPLLGKSKTVRGVLAGVALPAALAPAFGQPVAAGLAIGAAAMAGDLLSSFIKRRLGLPPSSQALGLDQIPEALLPAWIARGWIALSMVEIAAIVAVFFVAELALSKLLYRLKLRDKPY
jgi:CDP-diglyceride synthetase